MHKQIEDLTDEDLLELWPAIGGAPHLFEYGKNELKELLITGSCAGEGDEPIGLTLDYYTMSAIVKILKDRGFDTP